MGLKERLRKWWGEEPQPIEGEVKRVLRVPGDSTDTIVYFVETERGIIELEDQTHSYVRFEVGDRVSVKGSLITAIQLGCGWKQ